MPYALRISADATAQLADAVAWWTANRPASRSTIGAVFRHAFDRISEHPLLGVRVDHSDDTSIRCWTLTQAPYRIFYRVRTADTEVDILAIWHIRRGDPALP